tara:strand:- start:163 stop:354 length:192 start_codon:yes stop_codon:yes gene_type:complete
MLNKSKNTTITGILQFVVMAATQATSIFDGDVATSPDWSLIVTSVILLIGLVKAKDSGVSGKA